MVLRTWDRRGNRVNGEAVHSPTVEALVPWEGGAGQVCIQPPRTPANTQTKESLPKGPFLKYRTLFCLLRFSQESHFLPKKKRHFVQRLTLGPPPEKCKGQCSCPQSSGRSQCSWLPPAPSYPSPRQQCSGPGQTSLEAITRYMTETATGWGRPYLKGLVGGLCRRSPSVSCCLLLTQDTDATPALALPSGSSQTGELVGQTWRTPKQGRKCLVPERGRRWGRTLSAGGKGVRCGDGSV